MVRISPEQVAEAYEKTGLIPIKKEIRKGRHACALEALWVAKANPLQRGLRGGNMVLRTVDVFPDINYSYMAGFIAGWDGLRLISSSYEVEHLYQGYEDGEKAWNHMREFGRFVA